MMPFDHCVDWDSASQQKQSWWFHPGQLWNSQAPWQRLMCGTRPWTSIPSVLSPLQGCQQRALGCTALPGERDTSLCPACHWRPGHTREAAQRWPTYSIPVCCGVLWPGVVRKREQTGKLQTTPAIQTKRWKPARTKSGVIKKIDWLRCNAAFVCKTLPCKSIQSSSRFSEARGQRDPSDGSTWNSTTRFAEDFQRSYSKHRQKKEKDPHPMEPIWT